MNQNNRPQFNSQNNAQAAQPYAVPAQAPVMPAAQPAAQPTYWQQPAQPQPQAQWQQPAQLQPQAQWQQAAQPQPQTQWQQAQQPVQTPVQYRAPSNQSAAAVPPTQPAVAYRAMPGQVPAANAAGGFYPNGYPIYPNNPYYGNPALAQQEYEKRLKVEKAKKSLRYLGNMSGLAVILFLVFNTVVSMAMTIPGLYTLYTENPVFSAAFSIVASFIYMFFPFLIVSFLIRARDKQVNFFPFKKMNPKRALLCIPIGAAVCVAANIIINLMIALFEALGLKLSQQSDALAQPKTVFALIITLFSTAVMPALLEEFAIRGVILQPCRKYGMAFAIIASSVIFGIMHGNLVQAPFALIVGACFAFLAIKCDSLWIGVILHFLNNGFSVLMSYLSEVMSETAVNILYYSIVGVVSLAGIACFVVLLLTDKAFFRKSEGDIAGEEAALLSKGQKFVAFFINAPMIISFVIIGFLTLQYIGKL
ncbi:MAG: CPBP family intramembrane metalloprotease [Clostridia bacterium]|nr:CPBP family intramembrane metalloprotease [Clostridia bacterium]